MKVHVQTIRCGQYVCGNTNSVNSIWHDLQTRRGIEKRAREWATKLAKPGDTIVALELDPINIYRKPLRELFRFEV